MTLQAKTNLPKTPRVAGFSNVFLSIKSDSSVCYSNSLNGDASQRVCDRAGRNKKHIYRHLKFE